MRNFLPMQALLMALISLGACSSSEEPVPQPAPPSHKPAPALLDDQLKAIDKAKAVEDDVLEQKKQMDRQIENQGG